MARTFLSASGQVMRTATGVAGSYPITLACWVRAAANVANQMIFCWNATAANTGLYLGNLTTKFDALGYDGVSNPVSSSVAALPLGVWAHGAGVFTVTDVTGYLNGVAATPSAGFASFGPSQLAIGGGSTVSPQTFSGDVAECAVWSVALTAGDIATLAAGVCPLLVRPAALVFYAPVLGQYAPEIDLVGRHDLTLVNAPPAAPHPRVYRPVDALLGKAGPVVSTGRMWQVW